MGVVIRTGDRWAVRRRIRIKGSFDVQVWCKQLGNHMPCKRHETDINISTNMNTHAHPPTYAMLALKPALCVSQYPLVQL